ncbi:putative G protein-coupled receptor 85 [Ameca splendens]|uniref:G protein-coupled receptor 85 n=147 Tax=Euteleostomi TaxID=117571 RepID=A0ABV0Y9D0_9TELE
MFCQKTRTECFGNKHPRQAHRSDTTHKSFYVCLCDVKQTAKQPAGASEGEDYFKGGSSVQRLRVAIHLLTAEQAGTEGLFQDWLAKKASQHHNAATMGMVCSRRICFPTLENSKSDSERGEINMVPRVKILSGAVIVWLLVFSSLIPAAEAYDAGDALALLLFTILTIVGFCAGLGCIMKTKKHIKGHELGLSTGIFSSHAGDHTILQNVSPLATFLKLTSLGFIIGVGVVGNLLISILLVKDKSLHRAPYYFLLDLCASDILRSAICFPFVFTSVKNGSAWTYGTLTCKVIAFLGVLSCFHTAFMLFCVSVTRYLAIAHHRFYTKRLTFWTCLAVICMVWTLSVAMAFPPVLDVGTYSFIREEDQCTFQHRSFRANDSLGFMLLLALILLATQLVYLKLIFFVHDRRKMKPVQFVPAVSQNWTFHGPGASGQAAANWLAGFGRGPTPPTLLGIRQNSNAAGRRRLLVLDEFKTEKRISRMFYIMTFFFLALWGPYLVACYWRVFARGPAVPGGYLTAAVWMSFAQAGVNPFICIFSNRELRRCFSTTLLYCRKSRLPREPYCVI